LETLSCGGRQELLVFYPVGNLFRRLRHLFNGDIHRLINHYFQSLLAPGMLKDFQKVTFGSANAKGYTLAAGPLMSRRFHHKFLKPLLGI
jgi:hypothetical protein